MDNLSYIIPATIVLALLPTFGRAFLNTRRTYYFYDTYVVSEFDFFIKDRVSCPYHQITNVDLDISFWDRLTDAGDIVLHTAEDNADDIVIRYVRSPQKVEEQIYNLMQKYGTKMAPNVK
jgi:hypothetical protein